MSLFDNTPPEAPEDPKDEKRPLAERMRPERLEDYIGQEHVLGPGKPLRRQIERDELSSIILWGPPGVGKTTLAKLIARVTRCEFIPFSAVLSGIKEIKAVMVDAERLRRMGKRTILFIDEIHRFNKVQQDALLPYVEDGTVTLIGATTENPFFEVTSTLVSRSRVFTLEPLSAGDLEMILARAVSDPRGLGPDRVELPPEAARYIAGVANGDARVALNILEVASGATRPDADGVRRLSLAIAEEAGQRRALLYDRDGDAHYDMISAFIKSIRGSDPDAAVYWLARMLAAGEDPKFVARRMVVHAAEDIGLADPQALLVAVAAAHAVEFVGLPEARIPMAEAAIYLATAPKSNATVTAISRAWQDVEREEAHPVPQHLRDTSYPGARRLGHGVGYAYPHDHPGGFVAQQYVPENVKDRTYYEPTLHGYEGEVRRRLRAWWEGAKRYASLGTD